MMVSRYIKLTVLILTYFAISFLLAESVQKPKQIGLGLAVFVGDCNTDSKVDIIDFQLLSNSFGKAQGQIGYYAGCDFDGDNAISILDYQSLSNNFGRSGTPSPSPATQRYIYVQKTNPTRTEVTDPSGKWLATFTQGSFSVILNGAPRTFSEPTSTTAQISHSVWVRTLPSPFNGTVNENWLTSKLSDSSADILAIGMQFLQDAPDLYNSSGLKIAGDADYGPLVGGSRQEGSDFNDYLGVTWTYPDGTIDPPETNQIGSLDCSGFQRMIWGYRSGLPLSLNTNGSSIPRRSFQIFQSAPGVIITPDNGNQITDFSKLQIGDLVFFDADTSDGSQIDHMGLYIGRDNLGGYRFLSSRKTVNGPTIGDVGGKSLLDGTGIYAKSFRGIRRF